MVLSLELETKKAIGARTFRTSWSTRSPVDATDANSRDGCMLVMTSIDPRNKKTVTCEWMVCAVWRKPDVIHGPHMTSGHGLASLTDRV